MTTNMQQCGLFVDVSMGVQTCTRTHDCVEAAQTTRLHMDGKQQQVASSSKYARDGKTIRAELWWSGFRPNFDG